MSLLPTNVAKDYIKLQQEYKDGDLTTQGYLKKQAILLQPFSHLSGIETINIVPAATSSNEPPTTKIGHPSYTRTELSHKEVPPPKNSRRLLGVDDFPSSWLPWEQYEVFPPLEAYITPTHRGRKLLDTFADSLRYVNVLFTRAYGHQARKVPAHMPHMINKEVMEELQSK